MTSGIPFPVQDILCAGDIRACLVKPFPVSTVVIEGLCILALLAVFLLFKSSLVRLVSLCAMEICFWLVCKHAIGPDSLLAKITTWITAAVLIILTLAIVNSIHWHPYGERNEDHTDTKNHP